MVLDNTKKKKKRGKNNNLTNHHSSLIRTQLRKVKCVCAIDQRGNTRKRNHIYI